MTDNRPITEADLQALVDGQLDPQRRATVEAYLAAHPETAADLAPLSAQNEAIRALFGGIADEPVPARLDPHRIAEGRRGRGRRWLITAAAASVVFAAGVGLGWYASTLSSRADDPTQALVVAALSAHQVFAAESRHAVEVAATDESHLITWLSNRIGEPLVAPDLSAHGFSLVGGRLLPFQGSKAAQLMYQDEAGRRITLYITAGSNQAPEVDYAAAGDLHTYYWTSDAISCAMVGELGRDELKAVATSAWRQLIAAI
jgi:anti-sigma factor RsiW